MGGAAFARGYFALFLVDACVHAGQEWDLLVLEEAAHVPIDSAIQALDGPRCSWYILPVHTAENQRIIHHHHHSQLLIDIDVLERSIQSHQWQGQGL